MPRARRGRQLPNGTVVLQGSTSASISQMRCPRCQQNMVGKSQGPKGPTIYHCPACGNHLVSKPL